MHERRRHRSEIPGEAARLYLQAVAERQGLAALTLANDDGLLIAGVSRAPQPIELDWVAAVGCVCAGSGPRGAALGARVQRVPGGRGLASAALSLRGETLHVTAVGGPLPPRSEIATALERIFVPTLTAAA
jgi:hypothetical protein